MAHILVACQNLSLTDFDRTADSIFVRTRSNHLLDINLNGKTNFTIWTSLKETPGCTRRVKASNTSYTGYLLHFFFFVGKTSLMLKYATRTQ